MCDQDCLGELLCSLIYNGYLLVGVFKCYQNKLVLFFGDIRLIGGQLVDCISQYIQVFEVLGVGIGVVVGLLLFNCFEVLMIIGVGQVCGYWCIVLYLLGLLVDYVYVLNDVGISLLIIDFNLMFVECVLVLLEQVDLLQ